jgi:hypothetical protein
MTFICTKRRQPCNKEALSKPAANRPKRLVVPLVREESEWKASVSEESNRNC